MQRRAIRERILEVLNTHPRVSTEVMRSMGPRYRAGIQELRDRGYDVRLKRGGRYSGNYYWLASSPNQGAKNHVAA